PAPVWQSGAPRARAAAERDCAVVFAYARARHGVRGGGRTAGQALAPPFFSSSRNLRPLGLQTPSIHCAARLASSLIGPCCLEQFGRDSRKSRPYALVSTRLSKMTTTPRSDLLRMSRPNP